MAARKKILIVDDEIVFLNAMERNFSKNADFVKVLTASSGQEALTLLSSEDIDLIVADFRMPELTGLDLLYRIRSQWPNIEIILMTGYCTDELKSIAEKNGCRHVFEKPFSMLEVRNIIFDILKNKEKGFAGIIKSVNLTDLIQMCCLDGSSKSIRIRKGQEEGYIHIENGDIVHATCADISGRDAFYKILGWSVGSFEMLALKPVAEKSIIDDWHYLLLEGARKIDEDEALGDGDVQETEATEQKIIRLMMVDDSTLMIRALTDIFSSSDRIQVVGSAPNGEEALKIIDELKPDIMTLDVNMPVMEGGTALKHIMIKSPCPVVIISSITSSRSRDQIIEFLRLGAVDFLDKPKNSEMITQQEKFIHTICRAAGAETVNFKRSREIKARDEKRLPLPENKRCEGVVVINSGPGGHAEAIKLISGIPASTKTCFVLLQSIPDAIVETFARHIDCRSHMEFWPLYDGAPLYPGRCYLGSMEHLWKVENRGDGEWVICDHSGSSEQKKDIFCRFLQSTIAAGGLRMLTVLLSGAIISDIDVIEEIAENGYRIITQKKDTIMVSDFLTKDLRELVDELEPEKLIQAVADFE